MSKKIIKPGVVLTIANVLAGVLGYVFQVQTGRLLKPSDFALFSVMMSMVFVLASPVNAVFLVLTRNVTKVIAANEIWKAWNGYRLIVINIIVVTIFLAAIGYAFHNELCAYIGCQDQLQYLFVPLMLGLTAMGSLNNAYLQSIKMFQVLGVVAVSVVLIKLVFSYFSISLGFGLSGVLSSTLIANLVVILILHKKIFGRFTEKLDPKSYKNCGATFNFGALFPVVCAYVAIAAMTQLDIVIVKNFFPLDVAGKYAAVATLGKAVLYLPAGFVMALFPLVAEAQALQRRVVSFLTVSSLLTFALCLVLVIFYWIFGDVLITTLFGNDYDGIGIYLKYYAISMLPMALLIVAENFVMALGRAVFAWLSIVFAPFQFMLMYFYHESLGQIISIVGLCGFLLLVSGYSIIFINLKNSIVYEK